MPQCCSRHLPESKCGAKPGESAPPGSFRGAHRANPESSAAYLQISSYKSAQSGFVCSINASFQARRHFLSAFSFRRRIVAAFIPDQLVDAISGGEAGGSLCLMLENPVDEIIGHADMEVPFRRLATQ